MFNSIIISKDNSNVKLYQKLVTSKKARDEHNMFTLEGVRLIYEAITENLELHCVFVAESVSEKYGEALNLLEEKNMSSKIFYISDEISKKLSDTINPQGIYAICKKLDKLFSADTIINNGKYIILNNLQDPGNIGTIIRTADAVGIDGIVLTDNCCDIYNPKVIRSTMGSIFRMNLWNICETEQVINIFKNKNIMTFAAVIDTDAVSLTKCDFSGGTAVIIGNEGNGLPKQISNLCDIKLTIKMNGNINSLNAAMASGIIMWEMFR